MKFEGKEEKYKRPVRLRRSIVENEQRIMTVNIRNKNEHSQSMNGKENKCRGWGIER